jgi:hypothetical protein
MKYVGESNKTGALTRSVAKLSESSQIAGKHLNALSRIYHWQIRVKAFDKYKELERQLEKERNIELIENKHAAISNELLDQAVDYLIKHPEQLSPKTAIDLVQLSMRAGRLSVGLNPDKPGTSAGGGGTSPHINIVNQNSNVGDGASSIQGSFDLSEVEKKTQENSENPAHLQSILHVLNQSGAFKTAAGQEEDNTLRDEDGNIIDQDGNIIEADYTME